MISHRTFFDHNNPICILIPRLQRSVFSLEAPYHNTTWSKYYSIFYEEIKALSEFNIESTFLQEKASNSPENLVN